VIPLEHKEPFSKIDLDMTCPLCNKGMLSMLYKVSIIPYFGGIVMLTIKCSSCSFKLADIMAVSEKGELAEKSTIRITEENINDLIVLSSGSSIQIPELEIELFISSELGGEVTTIEGILMQSLDYTKMMLKSTSGASEKNKLKKIIEVLSKEIKEPSGELRLILEDKNKRSTIIPHEKWAARVEKERSIFLSESDLASLGKETVKKFLKMKK